MIILWSLSFVLQISLEVWSFFLGLKFMIYLQDGDLKLLKNILSYPNTCLYYTLDNRVIYTSTRLSSYEYKYSYSYLPIALSQEYLTKLKNKQFRKGFKGPFEVQEHINKAKRNDTFYNVSGVVIVKNDKLAGLQYYQLCDPLRGSSFIYAARFQSWVTKQSKHNFWYHVYSPFQRIPWSSRYDKKYSLKMQQWLVSDRDASLQFTNSYLIPLASFLIKGNLICQQIIPDYFVFMKSSKTFVNRMIQSLKSYPYFSDTKLLEIKKPSTKLFFEVYNEELQKYRETPSKYEIDLESFTLPQFKFVKKIKMRMLTYEDRKIYSYICYKILKKKYQEVLDQIPGKTCVVLDDIITSGSTMMNLLIPLLEGDRDYSPEQPENLNQVKILPISIFIRG